MRERMVRDTIEARGVRDSLVLAAMRAVPRHLFVAPAERPLAYADHPLPIGADQTISQPYIVAAMTELLELRPGEKVLEIGTGSGYQAAVLAEITDQVYSIEIVESLAKEAASRLKQLGYDMVKVKAGDGYRGWPEAAPFDAIIVTAAPDHVPQPLVDQLAPGGRLVIPVGDEFQELKVIARDASGTLAERSVLPVRFVPMTGEAERGRIPLPAANEGSR
jgi:protein-L-isoaspartate(D-aspartate) O-methyltransferase